MLHLDKENPPSRAFAFLVGRPRPLTVAGLKLIRFLASAAFWYASGLVRSVRSPCARGAETLRSESASTRTFFSKGPNLMVITSPILISREGFAGISFIFTQFFCRLR